MQMVHWSFWDFLIGHNRTSIIVYSSVEAAECRTYGGIQKNEINIIVATPSQNHNVFFLSRKNEMQMITHQESVMDHQLKTCA